MTRQQLDLRDQAAVNDCKRAETIRNIVALGVAITCDTSKPDGIPRKLLSVQRLHDLGWRHQIELGAGIASTYDWFRTEMAAGAHS